MSDDIPESITTDSVSLSLNDGGVVATSIEQPQNSNFQSSDLLTQLLNFGIDLDIALVASQNSHSIEEAMNLVLSLQSEDDEELTEDLKMVLIVRTDLNMKPGKVAAQCVHAALGSVRAADPDVCEDWTDQGEKTVCLKCPTAVEFEQLQQRAELANLVNYTVG